MRLPKGYSVRIVVICETICREKIDPNEGLNHQRILGDLYAAVANPMPRVRPGSFWVTSIRSQDFGLIDSIKITIPADLEKRQPLGERMQALLTPNRPPCLMDVDGLGSTWPLRFTINDYEITVKRPYPTEILLTRPGEKGLTSYHRLVSLWKDILSRWDSRRHIAPLWQSIKEKGHLGARIAASRERKRDKKSLTGHPSIKIQ
jgi:hypothetical protein